MNDEKRTKEIKCCTRSMSIGARLIVRVCNHRPWTLLLLPLPVFLLIRF